VSTARLGQAAGEVVPLGADGGQLSAQPADLVHVGAHG